MTVSVLSAAKHLGESFGWTLSNLTMQKLAYLAHMFHLGKQGAPLVGGSFQAWEYGPVHPELYRAARMFGSDNVESYPFTRTPSMEEGPGTNYLNELGKEFGENTSKLIAITHWDKGAWAKHYRPGVRGIEIPNSAIEDEYKERTISH